LSFLFSQPLIQFITKYQQILQPATVVYWLLLYFRPIPARRAKDSVPLVVAASKDDTTPVIGVGAEF
jgi:hypothetical protein